MAYTEALRLGKNPKQVETRYVAAARKIKERDAAAGGHAQVARRAARRERAGRQDRTRSDFLTTSSAEKMA
jgi:hypothetical protein